MPLIRRPLADSRWTRRIVALLLVVAAGCSAPAPDPLPTRPPVPEGWVEIARGGVRVAVPEEWGSDLGGQPDAIILSALIPPLPNPGVGLTVIGPHGVDQPDRPYTDEGLADWLLAFVRQVPDASSRSIVLLPAGRAVCVRATYHAATPDGTEIASCAIPTAVGVVFLQIIVDLDLMERYRATMDLIPRLLVIGEGVAPD